MDIWSRFNKHNNETLKPPCNQKRWLIVAPHADDEIFAIPIITHAKAMMISVDILILGASLKRKEEAILASRLMNANIFMADDIGFVAKDGYYHERISELVDVICRISSQYDKILAPALEGGHQDHDTAWLAVALSDAINKTDKGLYYRTYTAIGRLGMFITSPVGSRYCDDIFKISWKSNRFIYLEQIYLALIAYKSQWRTWIILVVGLLIKLSKGSVHHEVIACKRQDFDSLFRSLDIILEKACLFEIHGRMLQSSWRAHALKAVMTYNQHRPRNT